MNKKKVVYSVLAIILIIASIFLVINMSKEEKSNQRIEGLQSKGSVWDSVDSKKLGNLELDTEFFRLGDMLIDLNSYLTFLNANYEPYEKTLVKSLSDSKVKNDTVDLTFIRDYTNGIIPQALFEIYFLNEKEAIDFADNFGKNSDMYILNSAGEKITVSIKNVQKHTLLFTVDGELERNSSYNFIIKNKGKEFKRPFNTLGDIRSTIFKMNAYKLDKEYLLDITFSEKFNKLVDKSKIKLNGKKVNNVRFKDGKLQILTNKVDNIWEVHIEEGAFLTSKGDKSIEILLSLPLQYKKGFKLKN